MSTTDPKDDFIDQLAGEATEVQQQQLAQALAENPALAADCTLLREVWEHGTPAPSVAAPAASQKLRQLVGNWQAEPHAAPDSSVPSNAPAKLVRLSLADLDTLAAAGTEPPAPEPDDL